MILRTLLTTTQRSALFFEAPYAFGTEHISLCLTSGKGKRTSGLIANYLRHYLGRSTRFGTWPRSLGDAQFRRSELHVRVFRKVQLDICLKFCGRVCDLFFLNNTYIHTLKTCSGSKKVSPRAFLPALVVLLCGLVAGWSTILLSWEKNQNNNNSFSREEKNIWYFHPLWPDLHFRAWSWFLLTSRAIKLSRRQSCAHVLFIYLFIYLK